MDDLKRQAKKRNPKITDAAKTAIRMKEEMPELESVEYYFLDDMIEKIKIRKWKLFFVIFSTKALQEKKIIASVGQC